MFKWRPKWWNKPITWGDSIKMSLWSIPISLLYLLIVDGINWATGNYSYYVEPAYTSIVEYEKKTKDFLSELDKDDLFALFTKKGKES